MTPAIDQLKKAKVPYSIHEYEHDSRMESYGIEAVEKLKLDVNRVFKTLVVSVDSGELAIAVVPSAICHCFTVSSR